MDTPDSELPAEVMAASHAGRKIDAIKQLRTGRNLGLTEAKEILDAYVEGYPGLERSPGPETDTGLDRLLLIRVILAALYLACREWL